MSNVINGGRHGHDLDVSSTYFLNEYQ